jgi:hypothetical protein
MEDKAYKLAFQTHQIPEISHKAISYVHNQMDQPDHIFIKDLALQNQDFKGDLQIFYC